MTESIYSRSVHSIDAEDFDDRSRRSSLSYATESTYRNSDYTGTQVIQKREKPIRIGSYFASSTLCSQGSLDWALVYIEPLFYLTHQELLTNSVLVKGRSYTPRSLKSVAVDARVLICTGADGSALEGKLSGVASFTRAPASKRFQELWTVQMIEGNFGKSRSKPIYFDINTNSGWRLRIMGRRFWNYELIWSYRFRLPWV